MIGSIGEHLYEHRAAGSRRRAPGELNPTVSCECGCDSRFPRYDKCGRPRAYVSGHNPQGSPRADSILVALSKGEASRASLAGALGISIRVLAVALNRLKVQGRVTNVRHGVWALYGSNNG